MIIFTKHANEKFEVLQKHKFVIVKEQVLSVVKNPEKIDYTHLPLLIAQGQFDKSHVLRVVYKLLCGKPQSIPCGKSLYLNRLSSLWQATGFSAS